MWWVLGVGLAALFIGISEEESRAADNFNKTQSRYRREMKNQRDSVANYAAERQNNLRFHQLCETHFQAFLVSEEAREIYKDAKLSCKGIKKMIHNAFREKNRLKKQIKEKEKEGDIKEADRLGEKHRIIFQLISKLKAEEEILFQQKDDFYWEMRELEQETRELKILIRDTCGEKGADWYMRLEERKRRRLQQARW